MKWKRLIPAFKICSTRSSTKACLRDADGRDIDFKNTVILMTTNAGTDVIKSLCADPDTRPEPEAFTKAIFPELLNTFRPAFLGRMIIVPYYPLDDDVMKKIIRLKLGKIAQRVRENHRADFSYDDQLVDTIAARCTEVDTGARNVDHILTQTLLPEMSGEFLAHGGRRRHSVPCTSPSIVVKTSSTRFRKKSTQLVTVVYDNLSVTGTAFTGVRESFLTLTNPSFA